MSGSTSTRLLGLRDETAGYSINGHRECGAVEHRRLACTGGLAKRTIDEERAAYMKEIVDGVKRKARLVKFAPVFYLDHIAGSRLWHLRL